MRYIGALVKVPVILPCHIQSETITFIVNIVSSGDKAKDAVQKKFNFKDYLCRLITEGIRDKDIIHVGPHEYECYSLKNV